jgi:hypothetical protein
MPALCVRCEPQQTKAGMVDGYQLIIMNILKVLVPESCFLHLVIRKEEEFLAVLGMF